jgi:hypothetical protein
MLLRRRRRSVGRVVTMRPGGGVAVISGSAEAFPGVPAIFSTVGSGEDRRHTFDCGLAEADRPKGLSERTPGSGQQLKSCAINTTSQVPNK